MRKAIALSVIIYILIGVSGCALGELVSQAPTATPTPSRTPKPTFTPLVTETPSPEATPTATDTPVVVPTDTPAPAPSPMATPRATNTPVPPPTSTSPPLPPTATHTPTPAYSCSYVQGSKYTGAASKPGEGTQLCAIFEGYVVDAAGNGLNNLGVYFEHPSRLGTACVTTGDPAQTWQPGQWKHEFWCGETGPGANTDYFITIKESCDSGSRPLSIREDFVYKTWGEGHHKNIRFICSF